MRSDHLAKHVKTHNGSNPGSVKKGSSESCSDSEEQNTNDLHQNSPGNNNTTTHNNNSVSAGHEMSGHQHMISIAQPHQWHHHAPSPGLEHVNHLDIKPGVV